MEEVQRGRPNETARNEAHLRIPDSGHTIKQRYNDIVENCMWRNIFIKLFNNTHAFKFLIRPY